MKIYLYQILIALICVVMLVCPISAYDTLYEVDLSGTPATSYAFIYWVTTPGQEGFLLAVRDIVYFENVTHIEYTTRGNWPNNISASYETGIYDGGTFLGNATWAISWSGALDYSALGTITIDIHDFNRHGLSGSRNIRFANVPKPSTYVFLPWLGTSDWNTAGLTSNYAVTPYQASGYKFNGTYLIQGGTATPPSPPGGTIVCNFDQLNPYANNPFDLQCWPGETISPSATNWSWTITQPDNSTYISTNETLVKTLNQDGWHGMIYRVCNPYGCGLYNDTTFINVTSGLIPATGIYINLDIYNSITGALLADSTTGIKNETSGIWRYGTAKTGMVFFDSTGPNIGDYPISTGEAIELYAAKGGYKSANASITIPYDGYTHRLYLVPDSVVNATGAGTVVVSTIGNLDKRPVSGISLTLAGKTKSTNSAGSATFYNVTAGTHIISVSDPTAEYKSVEKSVTLTEGETEMVIIQMLRQWETATDPEVTPTEIPDDWIDTDGDGIPDKPPGSVVPSDVRDRGTAGLFEMIDLLLRVWPLIFFIAFMKFMKDALK